MKNISRAVLALSLICSACSDDGDAAESNGTTSATETATSQTSTGEVTSSTDGGTDTSADDTTSGEIADGNCVPDGACREGERCTCPECRLGADCKPDACIDDGACESTESCYCADCATAPECAGFCMSCTAYADRFMTSGLLQNTEFLCEQTSADAFEDLRACTCDAGCADDCGASICQSTAPSSACIACIMDTCATQFDACRADFDPRILCNPVTSEPCLVDEGEACDRLTYGALDVRAGFMCYPPPNTTAQCGACDEAATNFCQATLTCVDAMGEAVPTGSCGRYCCDDGDCGSGTCIKTAFTTVAPDLGVCDVQDGAGPGCDAPADAASTGSCVTLAGNE